jgi:hypothetical protein
MAPPQKEWVGVSPRAKPGAADLLTDRLRNRAVTRAPHEVREDVVRGGLPITLLHARVEASPPPGHEARLLLGGTGAWEKETWAAGALSDTTPYCLDAFSWGGPAYGTAR